MQLVSEVWQKDGLIKKTESPFLREAARILKNSLELVTDADKQLRELLDYPLAATLADDEKAQAVLDDNFTEVNSLQHEAVHNLPQCSRPKRRIDLKPAIGVFLGSEAG